MTNDDGAVECWRKPRPANSWDMCCVERARLDALLKSRTTAFYEGRPDSFFTCGYEVRIRRGGIGDSYSVLFDGDTEPIDITHFEHA